MWILLNSSIAIMKDKGRYHSDGFLVIRLNNRGDKSLAPAFPAVSVALFNGPNPDHR